MRRMGLLWALLWPVLVQAQSDKDSVKSLDEVTVTATRSSMSVNSVPYSASVVTRNDFNKQVSRTLPEALSGTAGVFIQKTNHGGGSPFVRGLTGNQNLLLLDGIRLNNSIFRYGPNQYMTLVDPFIVERIEIVRGSGSVQFGSDALGGVINMQTHRLAFAKEKKWSARVHGRYTNSGMEWTVRPEWQYSSPRFSFQLGASIKKFGDLKGGDTTGFQRPSGYNEHSFDSKLLLNLGKEWFLTATYQQQQQNDVPVYHKYIKENYALNTSDPLTRYLGYLQIDKNFTSTIFKGLEITLAQQGLREKRFAQKNNSNILREEEDKIQTLSFTVDMPLQFFKNWSANLGAESYYDHINSNRRDINQTNVNANALRGLYPDGARYNSTSLYLMHHIRLGRLNIEAGTRYSQYKARIADTTLGKVTISPRALVFQAGASYAFSTALHLYANLSDGFRAPNIDDLGTLGIVDFRYEIPAYDLKPERALNYEIGLKFHQPAFKMRVALFRNQLSDLITRVKTGTRINGYDVYIKENVEKGYIWGTEFQWQFDFHKYWSASGMISYLYGQSETKQEPLRRIPPVHSLTSIEFHQKRFRTGLRMDWVAKQDRLAQGDKDDNRIPTGGTPGFTLLNLYSTYDFKKAAVQLYFTNIFNADYRTHGSGINGMGRALTIAFTLRLP